MSESLQKLTRLALAPTAPEHVRIDEAAIPQHAKTLRAMFKEMGIWHMKGLPALHWVWTDLQIVQLEEVGLWLLYKQSLHDSPAYAAYAAELQDLCQLKEDFKANHNLTTYHYTWLTTVKENEKYTQWYLYLLTTRDTIRMCQ